MNNYIDIHSHILYGIDDGSRSIEESIEIVRNLSKLGFRGIVTTPHYIEGSTYNANNLLKKNYIDTLRYYLKKENIDITLYLGNEIFICRNIDSLLENNEITSINSTKYLLIELPINQEITSLNEYLFTLRSKGYKIIIAHPERYIYFQKDPDLLKDYIEMGILFQSNYGSIIGRYGKNAKEVLQKFLKKDYISFLASDIHRKDSSFFKDFEEASNKIIKIIGKEKFKNISFYNAYKVLSNEDINR